MGQQQQLSDLSSKYTLLFAVAMVSTMLLTVLSCALNIYLRPQFMFIDLSINLWCIYLQFGFAKHHYEICCGCCDKRCRDYGSKRTRRMMLKIISSSMEMQGNVSSDTERTEDDQVQ